MDRGGENIPAPSKSKWGKISIIFGEFYIDINRLYYAPNDFKHIFEAFFGEEIAQTFQQKLTGQIVIVNGVLNAIKMDDSAVADEHYTQMLMR
ncbi:MAG: hypothetical protein PHE79_08930 [Eubacteriales bacterium]|nr:hypothetical protein [Eubacteriales bacterium]